MPGIAVAFQSDLEPPARNFPGRDFPVAGGDAGLQGGIGVRIQLFDAFSPDTEVVFLKEKGSPVDDAGLGRQVEAQTVGRHHVLPGAQHHISAGGDHHVALIEKNRFRGQPPIPSGDDDPAAGRVGHGAVVVLHRVRHNMPRPGRIFGGIRRLRPGRAPAAEDQPEADRKADQKPQARFQPCRRWMKNVFSKTA